MKKNCKIIYYICRFIIKWKKERKESKSRKTCFIFIKYYLINFFSLSVFTLFTNLLFFCFFFTSSFYSCFYLLLHSSGLQNEKKEELIMYTYTVSTFLFFSFFWFTLYTFMHLFISYFILYSN
jgi:hypothetical protein